MKLYTSHRAPNPRRVRWVMAEKGIEDVEVVEIDIMSGEHRTPDYRAKVGVPHVPALELDDGRLLPESNAILWWLGEGTRFVPADAFARAEMASWMFWEQNQHEAVIAVRGALAYYPHRRALATPERMAELLERGHALLQIMEDRLDGRDWLVGDGPTLADLCLYGYTHTAGSRSGFDMARFPALNRWLDRIAGLPGYVGLEA